LSGSGKSITRLYIVFREPREFRTKCNAACAMESVSGQQLVLYLPRPKDHRKRKGQAQPNLVPKHAYGVPGVLIVSRLLAMIPVYLVRSTGHHVATFGVGI